MEDENIDQRCDACGKAIEFRERAVNFTAADDSSERLLCLDCHNQEMAASIGRMRRALSRKHIDTEQFYGSSEVLEDMEARGRIEWDDESDGQLPLLVIDGKPVTWHQFGRILSTYEGWQFKLEIKDRDEEL